MSEKLALRFKTVREAFQHYDADLSGAIEENEFRDCRAFLFGCSATSRQGAI